MQKIGKIRIDPKKNIWEAEGDSNFCAEFVSKVSRGMVRLGITKAKKEFELGNNHFSRAQKIVLRHLDKDDKNIVIFVKNYKSEKRKWPTQKQIYSGLMGLHTGISEAKCSRRIDRLQQTQILDYKKKSKPKYVSLHNNFGKP